MRCGNILLTNESLYVACGSSATADGVSSTLNVCPQSRQHHQLSPAVRAAILNVSPRRHCRASAQPRFVHQASAWGNDCWPIIDRDQFGTRSDEDVTLLKPNAFIRGDGQPAQKLEASRQSVRGSSWDGHSRKIGMGMWLCALADMMSHITICRAGGTTQRTG